MKSRGLPEVKGKDASDRSIDNKLSGDEVKF
jgi:hypothetical protein